MDQPARYRFIKYRGLQSFRSSPWDPKENLPVEYASLVEVENYAALQKHVTEEADERNTVGEEWTHELEDGTIVRDGLATIGSFIEVYVMGVSAAWVAQHAAAQPVLLSTEDKQELGLEDDRVQLIVFKKDIVGMRFDIVAYSKGQRVMFNRRCFNGNHFSISVDYNAVTRQISIGSSKVNIPLDE